MSHSGTAEFVYGSFQTCDALHTTRCSCPKCCIPRQPWGSHPKPYKDMQLNSTSIVIAASHSFCDTVCLRHRADGLRLTEGAAERSWHRRHYCHGEPAGMHCNHTVAVTSPSSTSQRATGDMQLRTLVCNALQQQCASTGALQFRQG